MTKTITWVLALLLSVSTHVTYAGIFDFLKSPGVELVVIDPFLDMRTGPGRGHPRFHSIEKGEKLHVFKKRTDWFKVRTESGVIGWVKRSDLSKTLGLAGQTVDFASPGQSDFTDRRWEFGVLGGSFEGADSLTTYGAFHLTQNISTELKYTQTYSPIANNALISINAVHKPFPRWRISPFFTLGSGEIDISPSSTLVQSEDRENPVYTVGGGAFIYISRRFLMRIEYNNHTLLTKRAENEEVEEWKAGFSVFF
ncbi:MAG: SH3 domain-containing protein [Agarilytica sp.]